MLLESYPLTAPIQIAFTALAPENSPPEPVPLVRRERRSVRLIPFCDNAMVTRSRILYGGEKCAMAAITDLKIVKIGHRKSIIEQKTTNLLALGVTATGVALILGTAPLGLKLLGTLLCTGALTKLSLFYWQLLHQKVGEYGLLLHRGQGKSPVITSHNLGAIQALYTTISQQLHTPHGRAEERSGSFIAVNMYTGSPFKGG